MKTPRVLLLIYAEGVGAGAQTDESYLNSPLSQLKGNGAATFANMSRGTNLAKPG